MMLSNRATPEQLITYAEKLAGGNYGESVSLHYSGNTIFGGEKGINSTERQVCGYVAYLLGVGLTNFPGCSEKDQNGPHKITPQKIQEFKKRTAYLLTKLNTIATPKEQDGVLAA